MAGLMRGRLLEASSAPASGEHVESIVSSDGVVVEQILSGVLDETVEFRQDHAEWAVVLTGRAMLEVRGERIDLEPGNWVFIPTDVPHRVTWTQPRTTWLAVHMPPKSPD
jgi:cupin 2 domain-containing protein